jgi:hypothetical protein
MNLDDVMAEDLNRTLLNEDENAKSFTFYPYNDTVGGPISVVMGPSLQTILSQNRNTDDQRRAQAVASLSAIRAIISERLGEANVRDPARGDTIVRATGVYAGTWVIDTIDPDDGDAVVLHLTKDHVHEDVGTGMRQGGG